MVTVAALSYLAGALAHLFLTTLLSSRAGRSRKARGLAWGSAVTMVWCVLVALREQLPSFPAAAMWTAELFRNYAWLSFLSALIPPRGVASPAIRSGGSEALRTGLQVLVGALTIHAWAEPILDQWHPGLLDPVQRQFGQVALAIVGLSLVEQFYRNTRPDLRARIKFLGLALGGMFAYDLYLYTDALLFSRISPDLWAARGAVTAILVPLISLSAARNPEWNLGFNISRRIAFHSATLLVSGLYLLAMGLIGYYLRLFGGAWGSVIQIVFLTAASFGLAVMLVSEKVRARVRVFLNKNFFRYAYDYREEWLSLIRTLADARSGLNLGERIILAIGRLVESRGGDLWIVDAAGSLNHRAAYRGVDGAPERLERTDPMLTYMANREWIVNLTELELMPDSYEGAPWPSWLPHGTSAWLLLPLLRDEPGLSSLYGVLLLTRPTAPMRWDWEVLDFLKTASRLATGYIALEDAGRQLTEARQFDGFNRLSAFVIHDLKNLIAQLTLISGNAERHRHNPDFVQDAFKTLDHVVERMNRLMSQLRNAAPGPDSDEVDLTLLLGDVVAARRAQAPEPRCPATSGPIRLKANRDRLFSSLEHIVHNAQDAAGKHGRVHIRVDTRDGEGVAIDVEDSGPGMTPEFIRERLFKPFDTTKGLAGMGIGAYECREYIRSLGGDVIVRSEVGKGTCFRIVMPLGSPSAARIQG